MPDKEQAPPGNGEYWLDNQLFVQCGSTDYPIRKLDTKGQAVQPPTATATPAPQIVASSS